MSKITNDGLTRSGIKDTLQLYPYSNSGHQRDKYSNLVLDGGLGLYHCYQVPLVLVMAALSSLEPSFIAPSRPSHSRGTTPTCKKFSAVTSAAAVFVTVAMATVACIVMATGQGRICACNMTWQGD